MGHPSDGGHHPMEQRWMDGDGHILLRFLPKAVTGTCPGRDFSEMLNVVTTWVPSCSSPTVPSFVLYGDSQVIRAAAAPCAPAAYLSSFLSLGVQNAAVGADNPPHTVSVTTSLQLQGMAGGVVLLKVPHCAGLYVCKSSQNELVS